MLQEDRRQTILKWILEKDNSISLEELNEKLDVSLMTIRRDIEYLEHQGYIKRIRGGATKLTKDPTYMMKYNKRRSIHFDEKIKISKYAVQHFIKENDIIILEGGTTVSSMTPYLNIDDLKILTNGLNVLNLVNNYIPKIELICCGGTFFEKEFVFIGTQAENFFKEYRAHKCFFGGDGLTLEDGVLECNLTVIGTKQAMVNCAKERILLIDSSKFGVSSLMPAISLDDIDIIVTDDKAPQDIIKALRTQDIEVHIAE